MLVAPDHETVLFEQGNVDAVNHAEAVLAREAAARWQPDFLWGCTLVTTVEPCAMCAGTQNPTLDLPCREVFARGQKAMQVLGPFAEVEDEIAAMHRSFWQPR